MGCITAALCFGSRSRKRSKTRRSSRCTTTAATRIEDQNAICLHEREINQVLGSCLHSSTGTGTGTDDKEVRRIMTVEIIKNDAELEEEEDLKMSNERKKVAYHAHMMMNPLVEETPHMGMGQQETCNHEIPILFPNSIHVQEKSLPPKSKDDDEVVDAGADSSASSSLFTYPTNHRYHNCTTSDDEESEVTGFQKSHLADEFYGVNADTIDKGNNDHQGRPFDGDNAVDSIGDGKNDSQGRPPFDGENVDIVDRIDQGNNDHGGHPFGGVLADIDCNGTEVEEQESSESLFSLSIDSRKKIFAAEIGGEKEVSSPFKLSSIDMNHQNATSRGQCIHSVLNPIENNMSQWRALEEKTISTLKEDQEKENLYLQELKAPQEPIFKNSIHNSMRQTRKEDENAVDTSLSSWLKASGKSKTNENSPVSVGISSKRTNSSSSRSFDDGRTILGALTLDELKQQSRFSAPQHSPSRSPEDMPIIGTVGSYWMHTGQCIKLKTRAERHQSNHQGNALN